MTESIRATKGSSPGPDSKTAIGIDIHAHFYPEEFIRHIEQDGPKYGAGIFRDASGKPAIRIGERQFWALGRDFIELGLRLEAMDRQGVKIQALSLSTPMVHWAEAGFGEALAATYNDAASRAHGAHPDRFVGLATLPMQEPARALRELERVAKLPGIRGIYVATNVRGRELAEPEFHPIYARMEELGLPLFLHPIEVIGAERLGRYHLANLIGNPTDTAVAAAYLLFTGVLDRFPKLEICLPHAGGTLLWLIGRIERGWKVRPECRHLKEPPSRYLRRFTYDTITHSDAALTYLIEQVGADRVMLGSDYCYDMGYERPVEVITRQAGLPSDQQALILGGTASRLLGLSG